MSVSKSIIIGSLLIAIAIFLQGVPIYSLSPVGGQGQYLRFNNTTGNASVCFMKKIEQETMPDLAASREERMKPSADAMLAELEAMAAEEAAPQPHSNLQPKAPLQNPPALVWVCDALKNI